MREDYEQSWHGVSGHQEVSNDATPSRFDLLPNERSANPGHHSLLRRMRQVIKRQDVQAGDVDSFITTRLSQHSD